MKKLYSYLMVMATLLIGGGKAMAQSVTVDGVVYTLSGDQAYVSGNSGVGETVNVLATVTIDSVDYSVTAIGDNAFSGCTEILSITLPEGIVSIGNYAFYENHKRQTINFPSTLKSIGNYAFGQNYNLKEVVLSEGFETLSENAFNVCSALTTVSLPETVTSIGANAFYGCSSLTSVNIPSGVTAIGENTFCGCAALSSLTIPANITSVGNKAFNGCTGLKELIIADGDSGLLFGYNSSNKGLFFDCPLEKLYYGRNLSYNTDSYYGYSPFYNVKTLKDAVIGNSVTYISHNVFYGCSALDSLSLPETVITIGGSAFYGCSSLTSVNIPSGVTVVDENTFYGCAALDNLVLPATVSSIGSSAFYGCSSLKSVNIPSGVTAINNSTFYGCAALDTLVLPATVSSIGSSAFYGCSSLKSVNIPFGVAAIGENTFYGCAALTSMTIPSSVTSVGNYVFNGCTGLKELTLEDGYKVLSLGYNTSNKGLFVDCPLEKLYYGRHLSYYTDSYYGYSPFHNVTTLNEVVVGDCVTAISDYAFAGCTSLDSLSLPETLTTIGGWAFNSCVGLTELTLPESVTTIGAAAFQDCSALDSLTLSASLTAIGESAFASCSSLASLSLPETLTTIGATAFYGCVALESLVLPQAVTSIGASAFYGCSSLKSVNIPLGVITIGESTFYGCASLTSMTIPSSVTSVGNKAFNGCTGLKELTLDDGDAGLSLGYNTSNKGLFFDCPLEKLYYGRHLSYYTDSYYGYSPFCNVATLKEVVVGDCVTYISEYAFYGCSSLDSLSLSETMVTIGGWAFNGCSGLTKLTLPESVTTIGTAAFQDCSALDSIALSASLTAIGESAFASCSSLASLSLPETLTTIGATAFYGCVALESIVLPASVTTIGNNTFYGCSSLKSVNIPSKVVTIGEGVFYGCASLTSMTIPSSVTSVGNKSFNGCTGLKELTLDDGDAGLSLGYNTSNKGLFVDCPLEKLYYGRHLSYNTDSYYGYSPFHNVTTLKEVVVGESVTYISAYAFYGCSALDSLSLPETVKFFDTHAFQGCMALKSLSLPDSLETINANAFYGCSALDSLTIPTNVTSIGNQAFYNCSSLKNITNYSGLQFVKGSTDHGYIAYYAQQLINVDEIIDDFWFDTDVNGNYYLTHYEGTDSILILPADYQGGSYSLGDGAFRGQDKIVSIQIPEGVESIGANAFYGCTSLTSLMLPETVTSIGANAFYDCSSLASVNIPSGVSAIGANTFYGCAALDSLSLPETVTTIGAGAFYGCASLTSVNIPSGVAAIGENTFYGCAALNSLTIPASVTSVGNYAFNGCTELKELTLADGSATLSLGHKGTSDSGLFGDCKLEKIHLGRTLSYNTSSSYGYSPFYNIATLNEVIVGDSVTSIGVHAFYNCSSLTSMTIPASVTSIGNDSFYGCTGLKELILADGGKTLSLGRSDRDSGDKEYALFNTSSLEKLYLGRNLSYSTGSNSVPFRNQTALTEVIVGDSVTSILAYAFYNCSSLTSMTIPASVTSIGNDSFYGCTGLKELILADGGKTLSLGCSDRGYGDKGNALFNTSSLEKLYLGRNLSYSTNSYYVPFRYQTALTEVIVGDSVTSIPAYAFNYCSALNSLSLPETVTSIGSDAFYGCSLLTYLYCGFESPQVLVGSRPRDKAVIYVPVGTYVAYKEQFPNNIIVEGEGNEVIVDITLPGTLAEEVLNRVPYIRNVNSLKVSGTLNDNDIATINESMINLLHLDLSKTTLTSVSGLGHANLCSIVFPDSCKSISGYSERDNLTSITLPDAVEALGSSCFSSCDQLAEVTMSANLRTVGSSAFSNCQKLTNITFKDSLESVDNSAFYGCSNLNSISFGNGTKNIGANAFERCSNLESITFKKGKINIGRSAFININNNRLTEIHVEDIESWLTIQYGDEYARPNWASLNVHLYVGGELLTDVVIPSSVTSIPSYAFYHIHDIDSVTISEGVTSIGEHAFNGCYDLASVTISEGVHTIQGSAFANCGSLRSVTLPSTLRNCAAGAFSGSGLTEVTCPAFFPPVTGGDLIGANSCTLYVPEWTLNRYKLANNWNLFAAIEPISGIYPSTISVYTEEALAIPDEGLAEDYTPNLEIVRYDASNVGRLTLRGEKELPLSTFRMEQTRNAGTMTSLVNYGTLTADSVVTQVTFSANNWHYLSFPYDVKIADIATLGDWVIRRYDGASRARADFSSTWQNVPYDSILHAGEGYIWYSTNGNFTVPAIENDNRNLIFANDTRYIQLKEHASATEANYGWNLIGNPYPCFYDTRFMEFSSPITVRSGSSYAAYSPVDDSYILSPLEAFFVQCSADNNVVGFTTEGRQTDNTVRTLTSAPSPTRSAAASRSVLNLYLENGSYADHTRLVVNESASMDYEIACDAAKFMSEDNSLPQLFTFVNNERMAINERPLADGKAALGVYIGKTGSYTLSLDTRATDTEVYLIDKYSGTETDLNSFSYDFTAEAGTYNDRFEIVMKRIGETAITEEATAAVKVMGTTGAINILNATAPIYVYNAAGALVATQHGGDVTIEVAPGVYVVKVGDEIHKVSVIK